MQPKQQIIKISCAVPRNQIYQIISRTYLDNIIKISIAMVVQIDCKDIPLFFDDYEAISCANRRYRGHK